jgi:glutamate racemase
VFGLVYNGAAAALQATKNSRIGVIATAATIETDSYARTIHGFNPHIEVTQSACPKFVPFTEHGVFEGEDVEEAVREYAAPLKNKGVDTVIYGCTHYPLLEKAIKKHLDGVQMIDPAIEIVEELAAYLHTNNLLYSGEPQDDVIYASDLNEHFFATAKRFLNRDIRPLAHKAKLNHPD